MHTRTSDQFAIGIVAYNRPNYVRLCLDSLIRQVNPTQLYLFQDSPKKGQDGKNIEESIRLFGEYVGQYDPNYSERVFVANSNLGSDYNRLRAVKHLFTHTDASVVVAVEDDVIFSPAWLRQMEIIVEHFGDDPDLGTFGATGEHCRQWDEDKKRENAKTLVPLHAQIAMGWTRRTFEELAPHTDFYEHVTKKYHDEYPQAWSDLIRRYYEACGVTQGVPFANTDIDIDTFWRSMCYLHRKHRVSTVRHYVKHIGKMGEHDLRIRSRFQWDLHNEVTEHLVLDKSHPDERKLWKLYCPYLRP